MFDSLIQFFTPKGKKLFFPLFDHAAQNVVTMAELLKKALNDTAFINTKDLYNRIDRLENIGDDVTHHINIELSKNFITPFDREDIHALTSSIDDVADYIHESANRMFLYDLQEFTKPMKELANLILEGAIQLQSLINELKNIENVEKITEYSNSIYAIETKADHVYNQAVADLFDNEKNPIQVIKYQEILLGLETATDMCKDVVKVVESIMIKNG
jgi:predicted phosphate transport protein (TIGR00153 family)